MILLDCRILFLILCTFIIIIENAGALGQNSSGARSSGKQSKSVYSGLHNANGGYAQQKNLVSKASLSSGGSRGFGLSAWGIISLILTIVIGGVAAYYVALFYPIFCKKHKTYDIMELTPV